MPAVDLSSYKVVASELSSSTKFDNLVQAIQDALNGLDNANIANAAAIVIAKLAAGSNGQIIQTVSGTPTWVLGPVYDRVTSATDVANTAVETNLYLKSIAGNDLGTNKVLRLTAIIDVLYNNSATNTLTLRVKFGGTTFCDFTFTATNAVLGANRNPVLIAIELMELGATNAQQIQFNWIGAFGPTGGGRLGDLSVTTGQIGSSSSGFGAANSGAIDTTAARDLQLTAQWSAASLNNSIKLKSAILELL